jgi:hypothetical protein
MVFPCVAARATVPPGKPVRAAVSTTELLGTFMSLLSFVKLLFRLFLV